jgi:hypothetical protein
MSTELGIRDVAFEVDDLQAAIDRVLPRLPSDCRFSLGGRPECRIPTGTPIALSRDFGATRIRGVP